MNYPKTFLVSVRRGCPRRSLDAGRIYNYFRENGLEAVHDPGEADLHLIFTCGGFDNTEQRSLRTIQKAVRLKKPGSQVIITGCLEKINPRAIDSTGAFLLPIEELDSLDYLLRSVVKLRDIPECGVVPEVRDLEDIPLIDRAVQEFSFSKEFLGRSLHFIKNRLAASPQIHSRASIQKDVYHLSISRGCLGDCSYCAIKLSMGSIKSRKMCDIVFDFRQALGQGYRRFVLIGEDIGAWGRDTELTICHLLEELFSVPGDFKIILNDFNARWLKPYHSRLLEILFRNQERIEDLRIPIQSGSNRILRLMNRHYAIEEVTDFLTALQRKAPKLQVVTHLIVGFPTETEEDYEASKALCRDLLFRSVGIFPYEERKMTDAANLNPKVPAHVIRERSAELAAYVKRIRQEQICITLPNKNSLENDEFGNLSDGSSLQKQRLPIL